MRRTSPIRLLSALILLPLAYVGYTACSKSMAKDSFTRPYDLDVSLFSPMEKGPGKPAFGFIKFRQNPDTARIIDLDTYVTGLAPRHTYLLQRAVNPITDSSCTSTAWLTLGLGLTPQAIHTDTKGEGHEDLWRAVTSIARGTQFRIHFQIIDSATQTPVLVSDCDWYEVR